MVNFGNMVKIQLNGKRIGVIGFGRFHARIHLLKKLIKLGIYFGALNKK